MRFASRPQVDTGGVDVCPCGARSDTAALVVLELNRYRNGLLYLVIDMRRQAGKAANSPCPDRSLPSAKWFGCPEDPADAYLGHSLGT